MDKSTFQKNYPQAHFLDKDVSNLQKYLSNQKWLEENEQVNKITIAGEGNMNCTLRVQTNTRSFIIKQARPWVEKYTHIAAPIERILMEGEYYKIIVKHKQTAEMMPKLIHSDNDSYVFVLEDLGIAQDFLFLYEDNQLLSPKNLKEITLYLAHLHKNFKSNIPLIQNKNMRKLNHQHMFLIPLEKNNGIELENELKIATNELKEKIEYVKKVHSLGNIYLKDGNTLLHGDYYPGSWLKTNNGIKIIDPEFCFSGACEFDMGVTVAHLLLAKQPNSFVFKFFTYYKKINDFDVALVFQFAGVEIMRRLIGVAQLPIKYSIKEKIELLELSYKLVTNPNSTLSKIG